MAELSAALTKVSLERIAEAQAEQKEKAEQAKPNYGWLLDQDV